MSQCEQFPTFRRNVAPPSSGSSSLLGLVGPHPTPQHNSPEDKNLQKHRCQDVKSHNTTNIFIYWLKKHVNRKFICYLHPYPFLSLLYPFQTPPSIFLSLRRKNINSKAKTEVRFRNSNDGNIYCLLLCNIIHLNHIFIVTYG